MVLDENSDRRTVLKTIGASATGLAGLTTGTAAAAETVSIRVFRDEHTSKSYYDTVTNHFDNEAANHLTPTVSTVNYGQLDISTVWDVFYSRKGSDAYNYSSTRGFRAYIDDSSTYSWSESTGYMWLTSYDNWPGDNGTSIGSAYADALYDHSCTTNAPTWAAGSVDSDQSSSSAEGTFMHEFGHMSMHSDHEHHNIYDYEETSGTVYGTSCMAKFGDDSCLAGDSSGYTDNEFGPTMVDCVDELIQNQAPADQHGSGCQVSSTCWSGWGSIQSLEDGDTSGTGSLPVEPEAIVDDPPGEPPVIE